MALRNAATHPASRLRILHWVTLGGVLLTGVLGAWHKRWLCDDAFISFRYARNLVEGHGLVYNAGEFVEGYTNFAWTVLMAAGMGLGIEPEKLSTFAGLLSFVLLILLLLRSSRQMSLDCSLQLSGLPLAALAWVAHLHARLFATSGLETMAFVLLVTCCIVAAIEHWKPWVLGVLGVLATLMRPDGALIYGLCVLALFVDAERRAAVRQAGIALLPAVVVFPIYGMWKLYYYGALLPNTFYAKSVYLDWWSQGLLYVGIYLRTYWPLGLAWIGLVGLLWRSGSGLGHWASRRAVVLLLGAPTLWLAYVARLGGDFMFSRFCLPVTPALLLAIELAGHRLWEGRGRPFLATLVVGGFLLAPWPDWTRRAEFRFGEESFAYPVEELEEARHQGRVFQEACKGLDVRVGIHGSQAMLAYYARFPVVIESHTGLTDRTIARQKTKERGTPGHEKHAPLAYLLQRGVHFMFDFALDEEQDHGYRLVDFGEGVTGEILSYDRDLMRTLAERGVTFEDFEATLDELIATGNPALLSQEFDRVRAYYFDHNSDPAREAPFLKAVGRAVE